ncbi:MAG: PqqD family protein [Ignavibacteriaceae bacterium]
MKKYHIPEYIAMSDTGFLFLPSTGETFTLNQIGKEIFKMIQSGENDETIFERITIEYDVDKNIIEKDFSDFVMQLKSYSLIKFL